MEKLHSFAATQMERLARLIEVHPWKIVCLAAIAIGIFGWLAATRLGVLNNVNDLVKADSEMHRNYLAYKEEFGVREEIVVVVKSPHFLKNREVADFLGKRFSSRPGDFERVYYRNDFSQMKNRMLFYAPEEELKDIVGKLRAYDEVFNGGGGTDLNRLLSEAAARFDEDELRSRDGWQAFKPFIDDFIGNLNQLAAQLGDAVEIEVEGSTQAVGKDRIEQMKAELEKNEYLTVEDGRMVLLLLTPTEGNDDSFAPFQEIISRVRQDVADARERFPEVEVGVTGEPVLLDDELTQSTKDSIQAAIITFVCISILFFVAYREWVRPSLAIIALVFSIGCTMGLTTLTIGHLNIISQACVIMLLGLGIDFGIQILGRYEEEMLKGKSIDEAVVETLRHTGVAILTGGSTTAVAFFTMCFNEFVGLAELGIISGSGILLSVLSNLVLLPALLVIRDKHRQNTLHRPVQAISPAFRQQLDQQLFSRPGAVLLLATLLTVLAGVATTGVRFDYNLLNLQNPEMESVQFELDLVNSSSSGTIFGVVIADSGEEASRKKQALLEKETVAGVRTLDDLLPENPDKKQPILQEIQAALEALTIEPNYGSGIDVSQARRQLDQLLQASREGKEQAEKHRIKAKLVGKGGEVDEAIEIFSRLIPPLEQAVKRLEGLSDEEAGRRLNRYQVEMFQTMQKELEWLRSQNVDEPVGLQDLPEPLRTRYLSPNGKILLEVDPKDNVWELGPNREFVRDLQEVDPNATGTPVQNFAYVNLLRESYVQAAGWATLAMVLLIFLHFRSVLKVVLTLVPLGLGVVWTGGIMGLTGIAFNPANIITLPLVIGIGVAFGVYVTDRHREIGRVALFSSSTGKAILLSALTTIIGFSSMMTGEYIGLKSLGLVMTIGIFSCFLASSLVLPQCLVLLDRKKGEKFPRG